MAKLKQAEPFTQASVIMGLNSIFALLKMNNDLGLMARWDDKLRKSFDAFAKEARRFTQENQPDDIKE